MWKSRALSNRHTCICPPWYVKLCCASSFLYSVSNLLLFFWSFFSISWIELYLTTCVVSNFGIISYIYYKVMQDSLNYWDFILAKSWNCLFSSEWKLLKEVRLLAWSELLLKQNGILTFVAWLGEQAVLRASIQTSRNKFQCVKTTVKAKFANIFQQLILWLT